MVYLSSVVLDQLRAYDGYESCVGESVTTPYLRPIWRSFARRLGMFKPAVPLLLTFGLLVSSSAVLMRTVCLNQKPSSSLYMWCGVTGLVYQATSAAESERARENKLPTCALDVVFWQGLNTYAAGTFVLNAIMVRACWCANFYLFRLLRTQLSVVNPNIKATIVVLFVVIL